MEEKSLCEQVCVTGENEIWRTEQQETEEDG